MLSSKRREPEKVFGDGEIVRKNKRCTIAYCFFFMVILLLLSGCSKAEALSFPRRAPSLDTEELVKQAASLAKKQEMKEWVSASGERAENNGRAVIDYSHCNEGYVMVCFREKTEKELKAQVKGSKTTATYVLSPEEWAALPLTEGNGVYKVTVFENVGDTRYAVVLSASLSVELKDEFSPFMLPNRFVDYSNAPVTVALASVLTEGMSGNMEKITAIFDFVTAHLSYDKELAATVSSGYVPELDALLTKRTGICFDYASLMTALLRCSGIPCKLVTGYAGNAFHAWISVWSKEEGWIEKIIYFDGKGWQRMDPTFADADVSEKTKSQYIGDGTNYTEKFIY